MIVIVAIAMSRTIHSAPARVGSTDDAHPVRRVPRRRRARARRAGLDGWGQGGSDSRLVHERAPEVPVTALHAIMGPRSFAAIRPRVVEEHRALLRAVERGNAKSAAALLRAHLSEFYGT